MAEKLDHEERLLAALAHAAVIFPVYGIIAPIVVWVTQRTRSRKVTFQAIQATLYQGLPLVFTMLFFVCYMAAMMGGSFVLIPLSEYSDDAVIGIGFMALSMCPMALLMAFYLIFIVYGLIGGIQVLRGGEFRYWLIGPWLARYLASSQAVGAAQPMDTVEEAA